MKELTLEEAALAWAQGKRVEAANKSYPEDWKRVDEPGVNNPNNRTFYAGVFNNPDLYRFRLAPEPPAKKSRPWTAEEVPVGALLRTSRTGQPYRWLIVAVCSDGITTCGGQLCVTQSCESIMGTCEHSIDGGKTWLPCGVEVDA